MRPGQGKLESKLVEEINDRLRLPYKYIPKNISVIAQFLAQLSLKKTQQYVSDALV
jgi:hypothetical protein